MSGTYSRSRDAARAAREAKVFYFTIETVMVEGMEKYRYVPREPDELDIPDYLRRTEEKEPKADKEPSNGVTLAPPLPVYKALQKELADPVTEPTPSAAKAGQPKAVPAEKQESAVSKKAAKAKVAKPAKVKAPRGMVVEILKLASRKNGASREELNKLTDWKGAPWKWLFKNSKKTGYCDRWGYTFKTFDGADGEVRYQVSKKEEPAKAAA